MSGPYVQFFDEGRAPDHERLGGKCASLVALTAAGMPVPPGFALTTDAYTRFIDEAGIAGDIQNLLTGLDASDTATVDAVSAQIRTEIESRSVPEDVRESFFAAFAALQNRFERECPVAVRSSATAEDLPDASFAGQQDTYLWLLGAHHVTDHVRKCWASLYTSRAIIYRLQNHIPDEGLSMSVAIQKMVNARTSGVAMTLDPANGDRTTITIDASWGLGELVVSGLVTPDNIRVDKVMLSIASETIGDKHIELVPDSNSQTTVEREVEPERRTIRSLSDVEVAEVAGIAKRAEKHFGVPQDIEWAIDRDLPEGQNLLLLQSRPETVWSSKKTANATTTTGFGIDAMAQSLLAQIQR